jgi:hypothetical protein
MPQAYSQRSAARDVVFRLIVVRRKRFEHILPGSIFGLDHGLWVKLRDQFFQFAMKLTHSICRLCGSILHLAEIVSDPINNRISFRSSKRIQKFGVSHALLHGEPSLRSFHDGSCKLGFFIRQSS